jgi:hypothetical protein
MGPADYQALASQTRLTPNNVERLWKAAAHFDSSLQASPRLLDRLSRKRVKPGPFSRSQLFRQMLACKPSLFFDFPIRPARQSRRPQSFSLLDELRQGFPRSTRARVRTSNSVVYVPVPRAIDRWVGAKSKFGVTDLHYIGTRFDDSIDTSGLNDFNLLQRGTDGYQSQDSLVISSQGGYTDSHSDDHSGSNHSFVGTKLWLLWDTIEGLALGLEDVERCTVYDKAAFDLPTFLSMKSSAWILIGAGQTMFIPAHLTHKVITLEQYLGLGSFHAGFPGFIDLLKRWTRLPPTWATNSTARHNRCSVDFVTDRAIEKLHSLRGADASERRRWGLSYLRARLQQPDVTDKAVDRYSANGDTSNLKAFIQASKRQ